MDERVIIDKVGRQGIERMVKRFYAKVPGDDILGPMYPKSDMKGAEERLFDFLMFRLAGDTTYTEKRGHPRLRGRHMPFKIGVRERDRWVELMAESMREAEIPEYLAAQLNAFFLQIADFMRNVPEGSGVNFNPRA
ncbi:MAG: globin [Rubritalea sp.]|uniref:globin domain-containing protein n=1 Tax=Rubritalea sp. TaxID=2109375 RepID=UPI0032423E05